MKEEEIKISKIFPNYVLSKDEAEMIRKYYTGTGFEPTGTEDVKDRKSFVEMLNKNITWFRDWSEETHHILERCMSEATTYEERNSL